MDASPSDFEYVLAVWRFVPDSEACTLASSWADSSLATVSSWSCSNASWGNAVNEMRCLISEVMLKSVLTTNMTSCEDRILEYQFCLGLFKKNLIILLLFNYSCLHFLPTPAKPTSFPCFHPPPWFCPGVLYSSSWKPFSPLSPPHSPLAIVRLFLTSMSLVIGMGLFEKLASFTSGGESFIYL